MGKTCTRKALKRAPFDHNEPSTCGVKTESVSVGRLRQSTKGGPIDELSVVREDVVEWSEIVGKRSREEKQVLAQLVADVVRQPPHMQDEYLAQLAAAGIGRSVLDKLRERLAGTSQWKSDNRLQRVTTPPSSSSKFLASAPPSEQHDDTLEPELSDAELEKLIQECLNDPDSQLKLTLSMWDFGGQKLFLSMHQLFLTENGV